MTSKQKKKSGPRAWMTEEDRAREIQEMLRMRTYGASYQAIADHFGIGRVNVWKKIKDELANIPEDEAKTLRALEALKLDQAEFRLQKGIQSGDVKAINALIRLSESRRKLLGLDMPEQHEVKISREEESLIDQLAAALTERDNREKKNGEIE